MNGKASAVNVGGGKKARDSGREKAKEPPAADGRGRAADPVRAAKREARAHNKRLYAAAADSIQAADELKQHAAAWVAAIRSRLTALYTEVNDVLDECKPGSVLAQVLDRAGLHNVAVGLNEADCAAAALNVRHFDMPIPALLRMRDHICTKQFPLADEFQKLTAPDAPALEPGA